MKKKILTIHFIYIVIILIIVIIYLITTKFGSHDELVKYLGFGLTITSLFVGLIAIFQAFFASNSLDKTISRVDKSSQDMTIAARDVKSIIEGLQSKFDEIPKQINDLSDKLTSQQIKVEIDNSGDDNNKTKDSLTKEQIIEFINNSSTNGILAIYSATKSNDTGKKINLNTLFLENNTTTPPYMFGYIVAARSFNVFKATYDGAEIAITDSKIHSQDIKPILIEKINRPKFEKSKESSMILLKKIEDFFSE